MSVLLRRASSCRKYGPFGIVAARDGIKQIATDKRRRDDSLVDVPYVTASWFVLVLKESWAQRRAYVRATKFQH
jgi:hypothetical protein